MKDNLSKEDINELAWIIYGKLKLAGCEIGNASVSIIAKEVEQYIEDHTDE